MDFGLIVKLANFAIYYDVDDLTAGMAEDYPRLWYVVGFHGRQLVLHRMVTQRFVDDTPAIPAV